MMGGKNSMVGETVGNIVHIMHIYPNRWDSNGLVDRDFPVYFWVFTSEMMDIFLGMSGNNVSYLVNGV